MVKQFIKNEDGQGLTEYSLIIALISIAVIAVMIVFRNQIKSTFITITAGLQQPTPSPAIGPGS